MKEGIILSSLELHGGVPFSNSVNPSLGTSTGNFVKRTIRLILFSDVLIRVHP